ncbi:MAG: efflux RND transporter periplasmic adaptor subunit [Puniceicoccales bacterium]|jgi:multidrug efflux system membrane fusion protein|nr:efflux RND transporter periplasmic adaptor subunit [Puniceicoccales bacterium]
MAERKLVVKIFFILGIIACGGCGRKVEAPAKVKPPVPVVVSKAAKRDFPVHLASVGRCRAYNEVEVVSQVSGGIIAVDFEEGASVEQGQPLFRIDDRKYRAILKAAEADRDRHRAQLAIDQVQLERSRSLADKDYISKQEFETYLARVEQDKASIAGAEAAIERAKVDLEYCSVRAPLAGMVGRRLVDGGTVVKDMQKLATIRQMEPMSVDFFVAENDFYRLKQRFEANDRRLNLEIAPIAGGELRARGVLKFLDNRIDSTSGLMHLKGEFSNSEGNFWPGTAVRVRVELEILKGVVVVPSESVKINNAGKPYLYAVKPDETSATKHKAAQIYPEVGYQGEDFAVMERGVDEGETIILRGNLLLGPGSDVIPLPEGGGGGVPGGDPQQRR